MRLVLPVVHYSAIWNQLLLVALLVKTRSPQRAP